MKKSKGLKIILSAVFLVFLLGFILSSGMWLSSRVAAEREKETFAELSAMFRGANGAGSPAPGVTSAVDGEADAPAYSDRFAALCERNNDFIGWLRIDGTAIDYPVMCAEAPEYYLTHDFDRKPSKSGVPFFGEGCALDSDNIILYGHNMKDGSMFADLPRYREKSYWEAHPTLCFDTVEASVSYEIAAAFFEKVHERGATEVFRYYDYGGSLSEEEFNDYLEQVSACALYDTGVAAAYGDQLITLSTCSYHTENGRFVVMARRTHTETAE